MDLGDFNRFYSICVPQRCTHKASTRLDLFLLIGYEPEDAIYMTKTKARSSPSPLALKVINSDSKNIYDYQLSEKLHRILMEGLHDGIPSLGDIAFKAAASAGAADSHRPRAGPSRQRAPAGGWAAPPQSRAPRAPSPWRLPAPR